VKQHLQLFAVEKWDDSATSLLAVNVLREWLRSASSDAAANSLTFALLERVAERPNGGRLVSAISRALERAFGIDFLGYQRARAALEAWSRSRALRLSIVK
jgi:hypothetical protein